MIEKQSSSGPPNVRPDALQERSTATIEEFARAVDRRRALKRFAEFTFSTVAFLTIAGRAAAHTANPNQGHCFYTRSSTQCQPPLDTYCSGCVGHGCPSGYSFDTTWYSNVCWCTAPDQFGRWFICCDCKQNSNPNNKCGCREWIRPGAPQM